MPTNHETLPTGQRIIATELVHTSALEVTPADILNNWHTQHATTQLAAEHILTQTRHTVETLTTAAATATTTHPGTTNTHRLENLAADATNLHAHATAHLQAAHTLRNTNPPAAAIALARAHQCATKATKLEDQTP